MIQKSVIVQNSKGLHGRVVSILNSCANSFHCCIWLECREIRVNAKSMIGVLSLSVMQGDEITIITDGDEKEEAAESLSRLIKSEFKDEDLIDEIRSR